MRLLVVLLLSGCGLKNQPITIYTEDPRYCYLQNYSEYLHLIESARPYQEIVWELQRMKRDCK